jgi:ATP-dependent helicase YprA (DUF1998 family)
VFTATNALELEVDILTIQVVIYIGTIQKMQYYTQESRQAGRNSKTSEAIIMQGY